MNYGNYRKAFEPIMGCMNEKAINFDKVYEIEDGSCSFVWCAAEGFDETNTEFESSVVTPYLELIKTIVHDHTGEGIEKHSGELIKDACHTISGCMNREASNFNSIANKENGKCTFKGCPLLDKDLEREFNSYKEQFPQTVLDNNCESFRGCIEEKAINFQSDKKLPNNTCIFRGCPILDEKLKTDYARYKTEFPDAKALRNTCKSLTGCMEEKAFNFDKKFKIADASCKFKGCPTLDEDLGKAFNDYKMRFPTAAQLDNTCDKFTGCLEPLAMNFEKDKKIADASCEFKGCVLLDAKLKRAYNKYRMKFPTSKKIIDTCPDFEGCLDSNATNFEADKKLENGKCNFSWCSREGFEFTNVLMQAKVDKYLETLANLNINYTGVTKDRFRCGKRLGCMESKAKNFLAAATKENGTCEFEGCPIFDPELEESYEDYKKIFTKAKLQNTCPGEQVETFNQNDRPHLGVLWVIDNSGSMSGDQQNLANNFSSFIQSFLEKNLRFTMGITTTDNQHSTTSMLKLTSERANQNKTQFIADFQSLIKVGINGSFVERGLNGAFNFLATHEDGLLVTPESPLAVIYVSDEEDQSPFAVSHYHSQLLTMVNKASQLHVSSIVSPSFARYNSMADLTNGLKLNINDNDFGSHLSKISDDLVKLVDLFKLKNRPFTPTLKVFVDGQEVSNWQYNSVKNAIDFTSAPDFNSIVEVKYLVKEK